MSPLRVVVNHPDVGGIYGIRRYSLELIRALANQGVDVVSRPSWAKEWQIGPVKFGGLLTRRLANYVPVVGGDIIHAANFHVNPRFPPADVVTVHDVMPFSRPELYGETPDDRASNEANIRRSISSAHIITDSEYTRQEMLRLFDADPERTTTVHLGISHDSFFPEPFDDEERARLPLARLIKPRMLNVLLMQSTEPRKRVDLVLEAASRVPHVNVIRVGSPRTNPGMRGIIDRIRPHAHTLAKEGRFVHLAHARDSELRRLYSSVDLVIHPSEEEGFGLPPLEALACGARVLASDIPCHREILGDAARYVPLSVDAIEGWLNTAWDGESVKDDAFPSLAARLDHARRYNWERTARDTMAVYENVRPGSMASLLSPRLELVEW